MTQKQSFDITSPLALRVIGVGLMLAGVAACFVVTPKGENGDDFFVLYKLGTGLLTGENVYAINGISLMLYPPATGFPFVPFALLPYPLAKAAFFWGMMVTLVAGLRALILLAAPGKGPHVWMSLAGIILLSSALRWGVMLLQMAPLLLGLLCLFIVSLHTGKSRWAAVIATVAAVMKVTLALPFLGILVLQRRFASVAVACGTWVVLNALGFLRLGPDSLASYRANVGGVQSLDDSTNINMPDPWQAVSLPRLDWTYLFYGVTRNFTLSQLLTYALSGFVGIMLLVEIWRAREARSLQTTTRFLIPMICLGCLAVYHHHYDLSLCFAPVLLLLFDKSMTYRRWAIALMTPLVLIILLLPIGTAQALLAMIDPVRGPTLVKLSFVVALSLALIGSLAMLRERRAG